MAATPDSSASKNSVAKDTFRLSSRESLTRNDRRRVMKMFSSKFGEANLSARMCLMSSLTRTTSSASGAAASRRRASSTMSSIRLASGGCTRERKFDINILASVTYVCVSSSGAPRVYAPYAHSNACSQNSSVNRSESQNACTSIPASSPASVNACSTNAVNFASLGSAARSASRRASSKSSPVLLSAAHESPRLAARVKRHARASHLDDRVDDDDDDDDDGIIAIDDVIATRIARRRRETAARSVDASRCTFSTRHSMTPPVITIDDVRAADARIAHLITRTPVRSDCTAHVLGEPSTSSPVTVHLKCEMFQRGGSFKHRGASNAVLLAAEDGARVVTCHSSGNHAAAVAGAAAACGLRSIIVVPKDIAKTKLEATRAAGGDVRFSGESTVPSREEAVRVVLEECPGAVFIHPYDDARVMAGQGTLGLEFIEQRPELDCVFVPISGGGMIGGIATAVKAVNSSCEIWACEPAGVDGVGADAARSFVEKKLVDDLPPPKTICDGLRAKMGRTSYDTFHRLVDNVVTVSDDDIIDAMRVVYDKCKLIVEPSGAAGVAAVRVAARDGVGLVSRKTGKAFNNIGIILCGGNLDLSALFDKIHGDVERLRGK